MSRSRTPIFLVGYQGEGISWGRVRSAVIAHAYRLLNAERPAGEESWSLDAVAAMCQKRTVADLRDWSFR